MVELIVPPLNPLSMFFTGTMCLMVLVVRREYAIIPLILTGCLMTTWQMIIIAGFNFPMLRFLIFIGLFRVTIRREWSNIVFNKIDKIFILFIVIKIIAFTIQRSTSAAFVYMLGQSIDNMGAYFFIRAVIHDFNDYDRIVKTVLLISIPVALFMIYEHITGGFNLFSLLGGVPEMSAIRNGRLRAQGAFDHSILAGTFGASLLPLSWGLWQRGHRFIAVSGILTSFIITLASSSSGPIMTLIFSIIGISLWVLRMHTTKVRNLFWLTILFLHLVMKAPVWSLIARIDIVGGSTGEHRYLLIDAAIRNFSQWFAVGIINTEVWGTGLWDITNQYIMEGANGGIITMLLFVIIMSKCFSTIGSTRAKLGDNPDLQKYVWSFGVVLFAYVLTFLSISIFGQMVFFYYLLIAMISSLNNLPEIDT